jgi:hypothetical protein
MSDEQQDAKIVVDEDWKSRVQSEKEAAEAAKQQSKKAASGTAAEAKAGERGGQIPSASFAMLVGSLAAQAMTAMGQLPDPTEGHPVVRPDVAKHYIDMLGMLDEKTKGNLTQDESSMLENLLHELRMAFITTRRQPEETAGKAEGGEGTAED